MNLRARWLSAGAAGLLLIIGLAEPLHIAYIPKFLPPSWVVIYMVLPNGWDWIYPALWTVTGLAALAGVRWVFWLRAGFFMAGCLFASWAIAGVPAITMHLGGNVQGVAANAFTAGLCFLVAFYVKRGERSDRMVKRMAEVVYQADDDRAAS